MDCFSERQSDRMAKLMREQDRLKLDMVRVPNAGIMT
jgi:hypothetical protein